VFALKSVDKFNIIFLESIGSLVLKETGISFNNLTSPSTLISENITS
jgi:hypothetical protein